MGIGRGRFRGEHQTALVVSDESIQRVVMSIVEVLQQPATHVLGLADIQASEFLLPLGCPNGVDTWDRRCVSLDRIKGEWLGVPLEAVVERP